MSVMEAQLADLEIERLHRHCGAGCVISYIGVCQSYHYPQDAALIATSRCGCFETVHNPQYIADGNEKAVKNCESNGQSLCDDKAQSI